jgi:hypothetical protein
MEVEVRGEHDRPSSVPKPVFSWMQLGVLEFKAEYSQCHSKKAEITFSCEETRKTVWKKQHLVKIV